MNSIARVVIGAVVGAGVGLLMYRFVGCRTGACPLTANPYVAAVIWGLMGAMVAAGSPGDLARTMKGKDTDMTASGIVELTDATFDEEIGKGITLVDFWAPWCGPCRLQTPILERVAPKVAGKAKIAKLNVDEHGGPAARFGVRAIPTLILFKDGKAIQQFVGVQAEGQLVSVIEAASQ